LKTGFLVGSTPKHQQTAILIGALASAVVLGPILLKLNTAGTVYVPITDPSVAATANFKVDPAELKNLKTETVQGPQGQQDQKTYYAYFRSATEGGNAEKYLV